MNLGYFRFFPDTCRDSEVERYKRFILLRENRTLPNDVYTENHHIVPKAFLKELPKKLWDKDNVIRLTAREHFIAHLILMHAYPEVNTIKAFLCLSETKTSNQERYQTSSIKNSRDYQKAREEYSHYVSLQFKGTYKVYNPETEEIKTIQKKDLQLWEERGWRRGYPPYVRDKLRQSHLGLSNSEIQKKKTSEMFSGTVRYQRYNEDGTREILIVKKSEIDSIPEGFQRGVDSTYRRIHRKRENGEIEIKTISKNDVIPDGWEEGLGGHWITIYKEQGEEIFSKSHFTAYPIPEGWYRKKKNVKRKIKRCNSDGTIDYATISSLDMIPEGWRSISSRDLIFEKHTVWGYRVREDGSIENRKFVSKEAIPEGWFYGRGRKHSNSTREKISSKNKGYKIMNKDGREVHIRPEEVQIYLDKGWTLGKPRKRV